ncbi:MAG: oligosaccharide flippase family protein, partial [Parcubacteria group bacterium]|nr:oligosaccharide flippase family protein [Parcubacteria group bacterium]
MSLVKNITTNVFSLSASNFVARFLSFFSVLIIIRGLSLYEYGLLTLAMAVTGPIASFSGIGLDSVFIADTSRYLGEKKVSAAKRLIISFVRNKIIITLFFILCGWFLKSFL